MLMEVTAGGSTVKVAVPLMDPELAVNVTLPCAKALATPPLTVAIALFEELHVAVLVKLCVLPSL
jgi:hypothetical protein